MKRMQEQLIWGLPLKDGEDFKSTSETACNSIKSNKVQMIIKLKPYHSNFSYVCQYACPGDERMKSHPGAGRCHQSTHPAVWLQEHLQGVHSSQGLESGHGVGDGNLVKRGIPSKDIPARSERVYWVLVIGKVTIIHVLKCRLTWRDIGNWALVFAIHVIIRHHCCEPNAMKPSSSQNWVIMKHRI